MRHAQLVDQLVRGSYRRESLQQGQRNRRGQQDDSRTGNAGYLKSCAERAKDSEKSADAQKKSDCGDDECDLKARPCDDSTKGTVNRDSYQKFVKQRDTSFRRRKSSPPKKRFFDKDK